MSDQRLEKAWYRHPMMWLVIAPPVGSVIAGIVTMILILKHPDPVLDRSRPVGGRAARGEGEFDPASDGLRPWRPRRSIVSIAAKRSPGASRCGSA